MTTKESLLKFMEGKAIQSTSNKLIDTQSMLNILTDREYQQLIDLMGLCVVSIVSKYTGDKDLCQNEDIANNFKISRESFLLSLKKVMESEGNNLNIDMDKVVYENEKEDKKEKI